MQKYYCYNCGVTLNDIKKHLEDTVPGLKEVGISKKSILHLMMPPRKNTNAPKLYKSLASVRAPMKKNDLKSDHQDLHFCREQAGYFFEAA